MTGAGTADQVGAEASATTKCPTVGDIVRTDWYNLRRKRNKQLKELQEIMEIIRQIFKKREYLEMVGIFVG